jgi:thiamine-phosphate pyrophosphorylase
MSNISNRCRLVLIASPNGRSPVTKQAMINALNGGDVASVILTQFDADEDVFRAWCEELVPVIQAANAAAIISDDTQIAGRAKADGVHITGGKQALNDAVAKFTPRMIVGTSTSYLRHDALELGEIQPDYLFIGALDGDSFEETNPKSLELAQWWAQMIEIPCIIMAGNSTSSVIAACQTGAEFVAVSACVFAPDHKTSQTVSDINALLETHAPLLIEAKHEK